MNTDVNVSLAGASLNGSFDQLNHAPFLVQLVIGVSLLILAGFMKRQDGDLAEFGAFIIGIGGVILLLNAFFS